MTVNRFFAADGDAMAGYVAYSVFLSLFPFAIAATAVAGLLIGPERHAELMEALFSVTPDHVAKTIEPVVSSVTEGRGNGLITVSILGALWVASNAVEAVRAAFDRAYRAVESRGYLARRLRALIFVFVAMATFALLGFLIIVAPLALRLAEETVGFTSPFGLGALRYLLGLAVFSLFLFELHLLLPSRRPPRRRLWPGIIVSAVLFMAGATAFSVYLAYAPDYSVTYGAFAGVIVTLLFFYLSAAAIIFGANVNAVLMALRRPTATDA